MTQVYIVDCSCFLNQELFLEGMDKLSSFRRKKVNQAKSTLSKRQRLGAGVLLWKGLQELGFSEQEMTYGVDASGKPFFENCPTLHFSLSHSGEWAVCALSDSPVGVDVQIVSEYNARVAERFFSKEEAQRLLTLKKQEQDEEFTRLWARKESRVKYWGNWKEQTETPPVTQWAEMEGVSIAVCCQDVPVFTIIDFG